MAEAGRKVPATTETKGTPAPSTFWPFESLRREVDRLFEDFDRDLWRSPFRRSAFEIAPFLRGEGGGPVVDVVEKDNAYELTAELPGLDEKNIEVKLSNGDLMIRGEKQEEKTEEKQDYRLHERRFGSFERAFSLPEGVDADKIEASFKNGLLKLTLPKKPEAQKPDKKIDIKSS